jgi:hypothetical protein
MRSLMRPIFLPIYRALLQTWWLRYRLTNCHVRLHYLRPSQAKAHQFLLPRPSMIWWDYVGSSLTVSFSSGHRLWVKCKRGGRTRQARVEWAHLTLPKSPAYRSRCAGAVAIVKSDTNTKNGKGDNRSTNFYGEYVGRCLRRFPRLGHQIRHLRKGNSGMSMGPSPATVELIMIVEA